MLCKSKCKLQMDRTSIVHQLDVVTILKGCFMSARHICQVCAVTRGGAFAEEVAVAERAVLKLPPEVDVTNAAGNHEGTCMQSAEAVLLKSLGATLHMQDSGRCTGSEPSS